MPVPHSTGKGLGALVLAYEFGGTAALPAISKGFVNPFSCNGFGARTAAKCSPAGRRRFGRASFRLLSPSLTP